MEYSFYLCKNSTNRIIWRLYMKKNEKVKRLKIKDRTDIIDSPKSKSKSRKHYF